MNPDFSSASAPASASLRQAYAACPLCESTDIARLRSDACHTHPLWHPELGETLDWMHCQGCEHVFSRHHWGPRGFELLFSRANEGQVAGGDLDRLRHTWAPVVERVGRQLASAPWLSDLVWLDVGCGNGGLVMTADEYGFIAMGLDVREQAVQRLQALGYRAAQGDLDRLEVSDPVAVLSMADVLEHMPYPRQALRRARAALAQDGLLYLSCPNLDAASWRAMTAQGHNPYWAELEHFHNFSRATLMRLLVEEGFMPVDYTVSPRYKSCMEVLARRV